MPPAFDPPLTEAEVEDALGDDGIAIEETLRAGGQGAAFRATTDDGTEVALKMYGPATQILRVEGEIEKLKGISSPYVVKLHEAGHCELRNLPCRFLTLEFIDGKPCDELAGTLDEKLDDETRALLEHVGRGIEAMWSKKIVHRDLKPANVMRRKDGSYVILDLGLAKAPDDDSITGTGLVVGTQGYMSPEQAGGSRRLTIRSDLFALGVTAYVFASGEHPFGGFQQLIGQVPVQPLHEICNVSREVSDQVASLMQVNRMDRPTSISHLVG